MNKNNGDLRTRGGGLIKLPCDIAKNRTASRMKMRMTSYEGLVGNFLVMGLSIFLVPLRSIEHIHVVLMAMQFQEGLPDRYDIFTHCLFTRILLLSQRGF